MFTIPSAIQGWADTSARIIRQEPTAVKLLNDFRCRVQSPCFGCILKESPNVNCVKIYREFHKLLRGRELVAKYFISCQKLENELPSMEHGYKYDFNYIKESASNRRNLDLARTLDTALARANLTYKEQALLEAIYKPNIIPCQGKNDLPACEDCLTCKRKERRENKGCAYHSFIYLNFLTYGAKPKLEYEPFKRYFSILSETKGSSKDIEYIQGKIDTQPFEKGKRKKPLVAEDEEQWRAKVVESAVTQAGNNRDKEVCEKTSPSKNSFKGAEQDGLDWIDGRGEWSVYRDIAFEFHCERLTQGIKEKLWFDRDECLMLPSWWITILPLRAKRVFTPLCGKTETEQEVSNRLMGMVKDIVEQYKSRQEAYKYGLNEWVVQNE